MAKPTPIHERFGWQKAPKWACLIVLGLAGLAVYMQFHGRTEGKGLVSDVLDHVKEDLFDLSSVVGPEKQHMILSMSGFWLFLSWLVPGPVSRFWARYYGTTMHDIRSVGTIMFVSYLGVMQYDQFDMMGLFVLFFTYGYAAGQLACLKKKAVPFFTLMFVRTPFLILWTNLAHR